MKHIPIDIQSPRSEYDQFTERLRQSLRAPYIGDDDRKAIREHLHVHATMHYKRENSAEDYLAYMNLHACSFTVNGPMDENHLTYYTMFSIPSQHVHGDCVEECLDKALGLERKGVYKHLY